MAKHAEQEIKNLITAKRIGYRAKKKLQLSDEQIDDLYVEHKTKSFYPEIKEFMSSGDVIALELEGEDAVAKLRKIMGATNSAEAEEGTIRCQFGDKTNIMKNCVHGSDSIESAQREIGIVFRIYRSRYARKYTKLITISLVGAPNAGKSTLINLIVGDKVSAISPKCHTTRQQMLGVKTIDNVQMIFLDNPGFMSNNSKIDLESDYICIVLDATHPWQYSIKRHITELIQAKADFLIIINKRRFN